MRFQCIKQDCICWGNSHRRTPSGFEESTRSHMGSVFSLTELGWTENPFFPPSNSLRIDDDWNWLHRLGPFYTHILPYLKSPNNTLCNEMTISYKNTCLEKHSLTSWTPYQAIKAKRDRFLSEKKQQKYCKKACCCEVLGTAQHLSTLGNTHSCTPVLPLLLIFLPLQFCSHFILLTDKNLFFHLFTCFGSLAASVQLMPCSNLFSCSFYNEISWHLYPEIASSSCWGSLKNCVSNCTKPL